jgi:hypothetical protein
LKAIRDNIPHNPQDKCLPAGSFRCDKLVRSSLASSIAGFIGGGSEGLLDIWSSVWVVSIVLVYQERASVRQICNIKGMEVQYTILDDNSPLHLPKGKPVTLYYRLQSSPLLQKKSTPRLGQDATPQSQYRSCAPLRHFKYVSLAYSAEKAM